MCHLQRYDAKLNNIQIENYKLDFQKKTFVFLSFKSMKVYVCNIVHTHTHILNPIKCYVGKSMHSFH